MTDRTIELDQHRSMAASKCTWHQHGTELFE